MARPTRRARGRIWKRRDKGLASSPHAGRPGRVGLGAALHSGEGLGAYLRHLGLGLVHGLLLLVGEGRLLGARGGGGWGSLGGRQGGGGRLGGGGALSGGEVGLHRRQVIVKCMELGVPIFEGRIDKTLFLSSLQEFSGSSQRPQVASA